MRRLICLVGTSGAGKSASAEILEKNYGYTFFRQKNFIVSLKTRFEKKTGVLWSYNDFLAALSLSHERGFNGFVGKCLKTIKDDNVVWESCLNELNLDCVLTQFDEAIFLNVVAPFETRVKRVQQREGNKNKSIEKIKEMLFLVDQYEISLGLGKLMVLSDWTINSSENCSLSIAIKQFIENCKPSSIADKLKNLSFKHPDVKTANVDYLQLKNFIEEYGL